jgi:hypothetical protein
VLRTGLLPGVTYAVKRVPNLLLKSHLHAVPCSALVLLNTVPDMAQRLHPRTAASRAAACVAWHQSRCACCSLRVRRCV